MKIRVISAVVSLVALIASAALAMGAFAKDVSVSLDFATYPSWPVRVGIGGVEIDNERARYVQGGYDRIPPSNGSSLAIVRAAEDGALLRLDLQWRELVSGHEFATTLEINEQNAPHLTAENVPLYVVIGRHGQVDVFSWRAEYIEWLDGSSFQDMAKGIVLDTSDQLFEVTRVCGKLLPDTSLPMPPDVIDAQPGMSSRALQRGPAFPPTECPTPEE